MNAKKIAIAMIMMGTMGVLSMGCGKEQTKVEQEETTVLVMESETTTQQEKSESDSIIVEAEETFEEEEVAESIDPYEPVFQTEPTTDYTVFPPVEEWSEVTLEDRAVQIDDVLYYVGLSGKEFHARFQTSTVEDYESDYDPEKMIDPESYESFLVLRDGKRWFGFDIFNPGSEAAKADDLPVWYIFEDNEALYYCYFLDGTPYNELLGLSPDEAEAYISERFPDFSMRELHPRLENIHGHSVKVNEYSYNSQEEDLLPNAEWVGYGIYAQRYYSFYFDPENNQSIQFQVGYHSVHRAD